jgi:hypothetical protein
LPIAIAVSEGVGEKGKDGSLYPTDMFRGLDRTLILEEGFCNLLDLEGGAALRWSFYQKASCRKTADIFQLEEGRRSGVGVDSLDVHRHGAVVKESGPSWITLYRTQRLLGQTKPK